MEQKTPIAHAAQEETYLFELWDDVWRERWLIIAATGAFALLSVVTVLLMPSWYRADVLLAPAEDSVGLIGQMSGLPTLSGLASLAGISVGGADTAEAIAVLKSRDFTRAFIKERDLLPVLFADEWDPKSGAWKSSDPKRQPDLRDAVRYLDRKVRTVTEDRRTKLVRLSIEWRDPTSAAEWANLLADRLNDDMRRRALREAETNVNYLQTELTKATTVTLQQSIGRLLEREMEKLMLARGTEDFAFRIIDRAEVPKRRSKPQRVLVVAAATAFGGMCSVLFVTMRATRRRRNETAAEGAVLSQHG